MKAKVPTPPMPLAPPTPPYHIRNVDARSHHQSLPPYHTKPQKPIRRHSSNTSWTAAAPAPSTPVITRPYHSWTVQPTDETNDRPTRNPHSPIPIPLHWQDDVKAGLDRDVRLGVLEPVPIGEPVTWCHRMVICAKKNGTPRRTVLPVWPPASGL